MTLDLARDDAALQRAVEAELLWEPRLSAASHVSVAAEAGAVTLGGMVETLAERHAALRAVWRVRGVGKLTDTIKVEPNRQHKRSDAEIGALAASRFAGNLQIPHGAIRITVRAGWIVLTGQVSKAFQKEAAEHDLRVLPGVIGIRNEIVIKSVLPADDLSAHIVAAIARSRMNEPSSIRVALSGSVVVLSGIATCARDHHIALETAWAVPGITGIEDDIAVKEHS